MARVRWIYLYMYTVHFSTAADLWKISSPNKYLSVISLDTTLTNDLNLSHHVSQAVSHQPLGLGQVQHGDDEGLLQLEPPLTSSEYSFSLDEQENLHDLFDNISMPFC